MHTSQVVHQVRAYSGFCSMKRLGASLPLWLPSTYGNLSIELAGTLLYTWMERSSERVNFLGENPTQCPRTRLEPGLIMKPILP